MEKFLQNIKLMIYLKLGIKAHINAYYLKFKSMIFQKI